MYDYAEGNLAGMEGITTTTKTASAFHVLTRLEDLRSPSWLTYKSSYLTIGWLCSTYENTLRDCPVESNFGEEFQGVGPLADAWRAQQQTKEAENDTNPAKKATRSRARDCTSFTPNGPSQAGLLELSGHQVQVAGPSFVFDQ